MATPDKIACKRDQGGRPVIFDEATKADFLNELAMGRSNAEACRAAGIGRSTLHLHLAKDPDFRSRYHGAKRLAVDALIDRCDELAERALHVQTGVEVAGIKLMMQHLLSMASRIAPTRWGERAQVTVKTTKIEDDREAAKRLAFLEACYGSSQSPRD